MTGLRAAASIARMARTDCPCGTGLSYAECCRPFHLGEKEAPDAVALMRSRFSAFVEGEAEYLWKTLAEDYPDRKRPKEKVLAELKRSSSRFRYMGLKVLDQRAPDEQGVAQVLFLARVFEKGRDISFAERSEFTHDGTGWRYRKGFGKPLALIKGDPEKQTLETWKDR